MSDIDLKKLINSSFLSENNKKYLMQYLELKGSDTRFFDLFNTYLKEETIKAKDEFVHLLEEMEKKSEALENKITNQKMAIEEKIETELAEMDPTDMDNKHRVWDEYYSELDSLGEMYQNELKKIVAGILQKATN